jgi:hypothetical protein
MIFATSDNTIDKVRSIVGEGRVHYSALQQNWLLPLFQAQAAAVVTWAGSVQGHTLGQEITIQMELTSYSRLMLLDFAVKGASVVAVG